MILLYELAGVLKKYVGGASMAWLLMRLATDL